MDAAAVAEVCNIREWRAIKHNIAKQPPAPTLTQPLRRVGAEGVQYTASARGVWHKQRKVWERNKKLGISTTLDTLGNPLYNSDSNNIF